MKEEFKYAPGLPGYGTNGLEGELGKSGSSFYYCATIISGNENEIKRKLFNNLSLINNNDEPLGDGRIYNSGDEIMDISGDIYILGNDYNLSYQGNISHSKYFTTEENPQTNKRVFNKYTSGYMVDNILTQNFNLNYINNKCFESSIGGFNTIYYNDVSINDKNLIISYTNGENIIGLVFDQSLNTFRIGSENKNENLQLDFKNLIINNNVPDTSGSVLTNDNVNCPVLYGDVSIGELKTVKNADNVINGLSWNINQNIWNQLNVNSSLNNSIELNICQIIKNENELNWGQQQTSSVYKINSKASSINIEGFGGTDPNSLFKAYFNVNNNGWSRSFDGITFNSIRQLLLNFVNKNISLNSNSNGSLSLDYNVNWKIQTTGNLIYNIEPSAGESQGNDSSIDITFNTSINLDFEPSTQIITAVADEGISSSANITIFGRTIIQTDLPPVISRVINLGDEYDGNYWYIGSNFDDGGNFEQLYLVNVRSNGITRYPLNSEQGYTNGKGDISLDFGGYGQGSMPIFVILIAQRGVVNPPENNNLILKLEYNGGEYTVGFLSNCGASHSEGREWPIGIACDPINKKCYFFSATEQYQLGYSQIKKLNLFTITYNTSSPTITGIWEENWAGSNINENILSEAYIYYDEVYSNIIISYKTKYTLQGDYTGRYRVATLNKIFATRYEQTYDGNYLIRDKFSFRHVNSVVANYFQGCSAVSDVLSSYIFYPKQTSISVLSTFYYNNHFNTKDDLTWVTIRDHFTDSNELNFNLFKIGDKLCLNLGWMDSSYSFALSKPIKEYQDLLDFGIVDNSMINNFYLEYDSCDGIQDTYYLNNYNYGINWVNSKDLWNNISPDTSTQNVIRQNTVSTTISNNSRWGSMKVTNGTYLYFKHNSFTTAAPDNNQLNEYLPIFVSNNKNKPVYWIAKV